MADQETGCPCLLVDPCAPDCSCAHPLLSGGCGRCARYGSEEQRLAAAVHITGQPVMVELLRGLVEEVLATMIRDGGYSVPGKRVLIERLRAALAPGGEGESGG